MKKFKDIAKYTEYLLNTYDKVVFSDEFYKRCTEYDFKVELSKKLFFLYSINKL